MTGILLRTAFAILFGAYLVGSAAFVGRAMERDACPADIKVCV
jgi:hypothetical protein